MKPTFALDLSPDGIGLFRRRRRANGGWHQVGMVSLDNPNLREALEVLHKTAANLETSGVTTKLILPNSQILYRTLNVKKAASGEERDRILSELDGVTPYATDEIAFDWHRLDANQVIVAVVARQTLQEAEAFAADYRFNAVCFVAAPPETEPFEGEVFFGETDGVEKVLGPGAKVERDGEPVPVDDLRLTQSEETPLYAPATEDADASDEAAEPSPEEANASDEDVENLFAEDTATEAVNGSEDADPETLARDLVSEEVEPKSTEPVAETVDDPSEAGTDARDEDESAAEEVSEGADTEAQTEATAETDSAVEEGAEAETDAAEAEPEEATAATKTEDDTTAPAKGSVETVHPELGKEIAAGPLPETAAEPEEPELLEISQPEAESPEVRDTGREDRILPAVPAAAQVAARITLSDRDASVSPPPKPPVITLAASAPERRVAGVPVPVLLGVLLLLAAIFIFSFVYVRETIARFLFGPPDPVVVVLPDPVAPHIDVALRQPPANATFERPAAQSDVAHGMSMPGALPIWASREALPAPSTPVPPPLFRKITASTDAPSGPVHEAAAVGRADLPPASPSHAQILSVAALPALPGEPGKPLLPAPLPALPSGTAAQTVAQSEAAPIVDPRRLYLAPLVPMPATEPPTPRRIAAVAETDLDPRRLHFAVPGLFAAQPPSIVVVENPGDGILRPRVRPAFTLRVVVDGNNPPRPKDRPAPVIASAAETVIALPSGGIALTRPKARPDIPERRPVTQTASAQAPAAGSSASPAATARSGQVVRASVARAATEQNVLPMGKLSLISVSGPTNARRALLRTGSGRILKVGPGDRLDGGKVMSIGNDNVSYVKGGKTHTLVMPRG